MRLVKDARVIFDVGANTGVYALIAQALEPQAQVLAFEPQDTVFSILTENARVNRFPITLVDAALSNSEGVSTVYFFNDTNDYKFTLHHELLEGRGQKLLEKEIKTLRLEIVAQKYSISNIDLMKIDVEGHEDAVLEGMGTMLADSKPTLLIEVLTDELGSAIERRIAGLGYLYFQIDDDHDTITRVAHLVQHTSHNYLLCGAGKARELGLEL